MQMFSKGEIADRVKVKSAQLWALCPTNHGRFAPEALLGQMKV